MKILEINSVNYGSTGKIMFSIADVAETQGHTVYTTSGFTKRKTKGKHWFMTSHAPAKLFHTYMARLTGLNGCFSVLPTLVLIARMNQIKPDLIHCHNLHGWYINLPLFFRYVKKHKIPMVWTLHDCWAMTGQCPHFTILKCDKWKTGCHDCPYPHNEYPESYVDRAEAMWNLKKKWFTGVENLTIVTPSQWLAKLVKQSFLKEYPVQVINNGIDLNLFKPTNSTFRERYGLEGKYIILGVSLGWNYKKGLDVFVELAQRLSDNYQIVLIGTNEEVDQQLPKNIVSIHSTNNQKELAEIYSAADVFVNPTREENYPTVNMEALACGTPVVTFKTGGSPEMLDETCGVVVPCDDVEKLKKTVEDICEKHMYDAQKCTNKARQFDRNKCFQEYVELYATQVKKANLPNHGEERK